MRRKPVRARTLITGGAFGLGVIVAVGGLLLAWAEGTGYIAGVGLAFSTVSTTGFGIGPQTTSGTLVMFGVFVTGVGCWMPIVIACFELGLRRYRAAVEGFRLSQSVADRWPPSMIPRGRG